MKPLTSLPARLISALAISIACVASAHAADDSGKFAIKGGGLQSCTAYLKAVETRSPDLAAYGGWIEGYITGQNQRLDNTFDLTPWQTTPTLIGALKSICEQMPGDTRFVNALDQLIRIMIASRLPKASDARTISAGDTSMVIYKDVLVMTRLRLNALGFDAGDEDTFGTRLRAALSAFQEKKGLKVTGFPDQRTLLALFVENARVSKE